MFFLTFILGLVALIADEQFGGQHMVGWVLLAVTVSLFLFQVVIMGLITAAAAKNGASFKRTTRNRRGF